MADQDQHERAAGSIAAVSAAATVTFAVLSRVRGVLGFALGVAGVLMLVGAVLLFVAQW